MVGGDEEFGGVFGGCEGYGCITIWADFVGGHFVILDELGTMFGSRIEVSFWLNIYPTEIKEQC